MCTGADTVVPLRRACDDKNRPIVQFVSQKFLVLRVLFSLFEGSVGDCRVLRR